jgi:hypothetical protein
VWYPWESPEDMYESGIVVHASFADSLGSSLPESGKKTPGC